MEVVRGASEVRAQVLKAVGMIVFRAELFVLMGLLPDIQVTPSQKIARAISTLATVEG